MTNLTVLSVCCSQTMQYVILTYMKHLGVKVKEPRGLEHKRARINFLPKIKVNNCDFITLVFKSFKYHIRRKINEAQTLNLNQFIIYYHSLIKYKKIYLSMTKVHRDILERSLAQSKLLFYCCLLWLVCVTTGEVKSHIQKKTIHFISNESKCNHVLL